MKDKKINKHINTTRLPKHIAFIMDGNGRWALRRGMPKRWMGHRRGYEKMIEAVLRCAKIGIPVVSIFGFSTENWNRPQEELDEIFRLIRDNMEKDMDLLMENGIKVVSMGDITRFPQDLQKKLIETMQETKNNTRCIFNLCINYGGRADIVKAVNNILKNSKIKEIKEKTFTEYLENSTLPDPDFVVRTSGEKRISNFMLWQMAYSELYFPKRFWPAIDAKFIDKCVLEYQKRKRRYGAIK